MFKAFLRKRDKETSVLNTDSFDKRRFKEIYNMSERLQNITSELPTFEQLLSDIWASLYKIKPQLKEDYEFGDHLAPNKELISRMMQEESYKEYHQNTQLDDILSAISTIHYGQETQNWIREQQHKNNELQKQMENIQQMLEDMNEQDKKQESDSVDTDSKQEQQSENKSESEQNQNKGQTKSNQNQMEQQLNQAMSELGDQLKQSIQQDPSSFRQAMDNAASGSDDTMDSMKSLIGGDQAGNEESELKKVPLRDKVKLAEMIMQSPQLKEIADWAGRFAKIARTKQRKMKHKNMTEQSGVEQGSDIERLLPSELVQYSNKKTRNEFLRRFSEKETLQYEQKGKETLGKGSIILCIDQSTSMIKLDEQSKAFALALMSIAKRQKRNFAYVPFSAKTGRVRNFDKGKIEIKDMVSLATDFMGGGTNFGYPLKSAINIVKRDQFKDADIVFVTDGHDTLSESFIHEFLKTKVDYKFNVLSLVIGRGRTGTVKLFSDRVLNIKNFNDENSFKAFEI